MPLGLQEEECYFPLSWKHIFQESKLSFSLFSSPVGETFLIILETGPNRRALGGDNFLVLDVEEIVVTWRRAM